MVADKAWEAAEPHWSVNWHLREAGEYLGTGSSWCDLPTTALTSSAPLQLGTRSPSVLPSTLILAPSLVISEECQCGERQRGEPEGRAGPWAVPASAEAREPAPAAHGLPSGTAATAPQATSVPPSARQPGLVVVVGRFPGSHMSPCSEAEAPGPAPGPSIQLLRPRASTRPGPGVGIAHACHCPGGPCESFLPGGWHHRDTTLIH